MKKRLLLLISLLALPCTVYAGDITSTGMSQKDQVTYYGNIRTVVNNLMNRAKSQTLSSAGLRIEPSGSTTAEVQNDLYAVCNGTLVTKAAGTDMPEINAGGSDVISGSRENIYMFVIDSTGSITCLHGTQAATLATVTLPAIPESNALIGLLRVAVAVGGTFTAGTTKLDAGSMTTTAITTQGLVDFNPGTALSLTGL